jgi:hypothetical protein
LIFPSKYFLFYSKPVFFGATFDHSIFSYVLPAKKNMWWKKIRIQ